MYTAVLCAQLAYCVVQFMEKDVTLSESVSYVKCSRYVLFVMIKIVVYVHV